MAFAPLAGMVAGPLLEGALAGGALGGLATTLGAGGLGALTAGTISLLQGDDLLTAGLNALGAGSGAGGIKDLAKFGASGSALPAAAEALEGGVAQGALTSEATGFLPEAVKSASFQMDPAYSQFAISTPTVPFSLENAQTGLGKLFETGGMDAFKAATGSSALSSLGVPAAGLAIQGMSPSPAQYGLAPDPYAGSLGPFTSMAELRNQNQEMGYAEGGIATLNPMAGQFDARNMPQGYNEPAHETYKAGGEVEHFADGGFTSLSQLRNIRSGRVTPAPVAIPAPVVAKRPISLFSGPNFLPQVQAPKPPSYLFGMRVNPSIPAPEPAPLSLADIRRNLGYKKGGYLDGPGDGMSDSIPATIGEKQPARLADGEFVVPADVVSHLGNGSTKAGAKRLYSMMDKVRKARTGTTKQGKQINPDKYMPA